MTNASLIATGNFEITGDKIECRNCTGSGLVADTQAAAISHGIKLINRRCRTCGGDGEIYPLTPVSVTQEVGEIPDWMIG